MNANPQFLCRPPVGFIVEGHGEYNCYPSLVCRIADAKGFKVPRVNAGGYGNVLRHLGEQLSDLVLADHPLHVIVTLDLKDVLERGVHASCRDLRDSLRAEAEEWLAGARKDARLQPLPESIMVVIQVQQFETWLVADVLSQTGAGYLAIEPPVFQNVDEELPNPSGWLRKHLQHGMSQKNPSDAKLIVSCLDLNVMRAKSPSFDKFYREVSACYEHWSCLSQGDCM